MDVARSKVLIVSPDIELRESVTAVLLRAGFIVDQADTAETARLACVERVAPDVLLVDGCRAWDGLQSVLDDVPGSDPTRAPTVLLLATSRTSEVVRTHASVDDVLEVPAPHAVPALVALRRRLGSPARRPGPSRSRRRRTADRSSDVA